MSATLLPPGPSRCVEAGLCEVSFDSEADGFGVGVARAPSSLSTRPKLPDRLFTFTH